MQTRQLTLFAAATISTVAASLAAAALTPVSLVGIAGTNLRAYTLGTDYPVGPITLNIAGVPLELTPLPSDPNSIGVMQVWFDSPAFSVPVNFANATQVHVLMNSGFGQFGLINGRLEFHGTGGAFESIAIEQGVNIRDHRQHLYNNVNTHPTLVETYFGSQGARLDRMSFALPAAFSGQTLTEIRLVGTTFGNPVGAPFIAAITVEHTGCDTIDFNQNGVFPEDQDITDFFTVLAGGECSGCNDIDFNNNGVFPEDQDVVDFFNVLAGGDCP